jgi:hypothetical protein
MMNGVPVYVEANPPLGQPAVTLAAIVQTPPVSQTTRPRVPVLAKALSVSISVGSVVGASFDVSLVDKSGVGTGRGFGFDRALLSNLELQESCPL